VWRMRHRLGRSPLHIDPDTVPNAMDVITPPGVSQATELDYLHAQQVTLQGCSSRGPTGGYSSFAPAATGSNPAGHLVCWS
jgi:hypothetical protein